MAKDPALLWYWNDWNGGTVTFSRFLKGCYIDLLSAQFNNGRLSLEEIKTVLGSDFGASWPTLQKKFKKDETGLFFNERLEHEVEKRKKFSESRRKNISKRYPKSTSVDTSVLHKNVLVENENENENENEKGVQGEKQIYGSGFLRGEKAAHEMLVSQLWHEKVAIAVSASTATVKLYLAMFLAEQSAIAEYEDRPLRDLQSHFIKWLKIEIKKERKETNDNRKKITNPANQRTVNTGKSFGSYDD